MGVTTHLRVVTVLQEGLDISVEKDFIKYNNKI